MADVDFEVLNGQEVVTDVIVADNPKEFQLDVSSSEGVPSTGSEAAPGTFRSVPLLIRTIP